MVQPVWTTEHAATLKALREAAGLDVTVLAKRHNLSTTQVRQLEDGGESAFYTPQIKWAVGRKLTLALGGRFAEQSPAPHHDVATPPSPSGPVTATQITSPGNALADPSAAKKPVEKAPRRPDVLPQKRGGGLGLSSIGLGVVVLAGLVWVLYEPQRGPATPSVKTESPPAPPPLPAVADPPAAAPSVPVSVAATEPPPAAVPATWTHDGDECRWVARAPDVTPGTGTRPDNYVHVVARETVTVCWRDAEKKTRKQTLQALEAVSFWGTPPFQVYASSPNALKIYFKGLAVSWPDGDATHISLGRRASSAD